MMAREIIKPTITIEISTREMHDDGTLFEGNAGGRTAKHPHTHSAWGLILNFSS
jgi:hypothetical protein